MKVVASVQAKRGSSRGLVHYIAHSKLDVEREPEKGREIFNGFANDLSVTSANNSLKIGIAKARPSNDELHHLVLSFRPADYHALGRDEKARRSAVKDVTRTAMKRLEISLSAERLYWAAAVHLNTENPHVHIAIQKQYFTEEIERQVLAKIPREALPHFEHQDNEKIFVSGFLIEVANERMEHLIERERNRPQTYQNNVRTNARVRPAPAISEAEMDRDASHRTAREREILRHGILAEYERHLIESRISEFVEHGDKMRFLVTDPESGTRRRLSLSDLKGREAASDTGPKSPPEIQIRTILIKMLAKDETARTKLQRDTADARRDANRVKARYRKNGWKLPSPSFTNDELDKLQEHYLQASDLRRFSYLESVRSELERSAEIGPRDTEALRRIAATKMISELRGKVHEKNYRDLSEKRYYTNVEIGAKRVSLAGLHREETTSASPVARFVENLKRSVSLFSVRASTSHAKNENDQIRDEIVRILDDRLSEIETDKKGEKKKAKVLEKVLSESARASAQPVYSAEQLAEIESLSLRLNFRATYENNWDEQRRFIESAESDCLAYRIALKKDPSADFEEHKRALIAGRTLAREMVARMELEKAQENLKSFTEFKRFQKFAIADQKTGTSEFLSMHDVDLPWKATLLDRALDRVFESREHRFLRRTVTSLANAREQRLKDEVDGSKEILGSASHSAAEFIQFSIFGLRNEPTFKPVFTSSEIATIEMRAANTPDAGEAARLRKVLESSADPSPRTLKEILRDFENPQTTSGKDLKHDPVVHMIADRMGPDVSELQERMPPKQEKIKEPKFYGPSR